MIQVADEMLVLCMSSALRACRDLSDPAARLAAIRAAPGGDLPLALREERPGLFLALEARAARYEAVRRERGFA